jgi:hypothetical protein
MNRIVNALAAMTLLALNACATASDDVRPTFQSAAVYNDLSCEQIGSKINDISKQVNSASSKQDEKRKADQAATGVGVIVFWPALFLLATPSHKRELADLKGTYEALGRAAETKHCSI